MYLLYERKVMLSQSGLSIYEPYEKVDIKMSNYMSNNKYKNFPAFMTDGRSIGASWQPGSTVDETIRKDNNITSNWQYRRYITSNANEIRKYNFNQACNDTGYFIRNENKTLDRSLKYDTPTFYKSDKDDIKHVGDNSSDLKNAYLSKEQLQARMVVPSITQEELLRNWGEYIQNVPSKK